MEIKTKKKATAKRVVGYRNQRNVMFYINDERDKEHLAVNHRYVLHFKPLWQEAIISEFTTLLTPFYSNVTRIRMDTGDMLNDMSDQEILRYLYDNSKEVLLLEPEEADDGLDVDHYMTQWVRYKTDCDLIQAAYLSRSVTAGAEEKRIGETTISREVALPILDDMLKRFLRGMQEAEDMLKGITIPTASCVKAGTNYTYTARGTF